MSNRVLNSQIPSFGQILFQNNEVSSNFIEANLKAYDG